MRPATLCSSTFLASPVALIFLARLEPWIFPEKAPLQHRRQPHDRMYALAVGPTMALDQPVPWAEAVTSFLAMAKPRPQTKTWRRQTVKNQIVLARRFLQRMQRLSSSPESDSNAEDNRTLRIQK